MSISNPQASPAAAVIRLVVFVLDRQRYGLELTAAERVLPMVAIAPLPSAPEIVLGAINLHGDVVPVVDVRRRLGLAAVEHVPSARLLLARTGELLVALPVDDVVGVVDVPETAVGAPGIDGIAGIARLDDGLLLIQDIDAFLSLEEARRLIRSLEGAAGVRA